MTSEASGAFRRQCQDMSEYMRTRFRDLKWSPTPQALDSIWGDILVHRQVLQEYCEDLITTQPSVANALTADRYLWKLVYYDAILECRKRLRLHVPQHSVSQGSSIVGSIRSSEPQSSSRATSISVDTPLEEWQREWWSVVLTTLFNEALGYFQCLYDLVIPQLKSRNALPFAIQHFRASQVPLPPSFLIARRLLVYIGDIYRYQVMYLPQLAYGSAGPVDTAELIDLARCTYARATAMYFDSGRACMQMSLLCICAHQRFSAMFWHMCALCYADHQHMYTNALVKVAAENSDDDNDDDDDPIELLVIELAQAVVAGKGSETDEIYGQLLDVLNADLEEAKSGTAVVNLDAEFWEREYQLSVALAALLTSTVLGQAKGHHVARIQDLVSVLVQRQVLCLQQALALGEDAHSVYPAISVCVWIDLWRSTPFLTDWLDTRPASGQALLTLLAQLVVDNLGGDEQLDAIAQSVLPHDVSLMGWVTLRRVQKHLRYEDIKCERLWPDPRATTRVVLVRVHLLMQMLVDSQVVIVPQSREIVAMDRVNVVPDFDFWCLRLVQIQKWAQPGSAYAVVLAAAVRQQLLENGGIGAKAALDFVHVMKR
ncbi:hypothetical protein GGH94_005869 [Coemansia aciculifera]|uniref:Uncharacterized protein n=1 Tax=Coemansia aciculifera TaxID=417176 RepID=A0A9W8ICQ4_9FUNG|nr:hypothetical protein GGH94_005869 [Coemansia aciculifera]KAJ2872150.1 hypothetical protein GGH93_004260 [Coemansia aciculifera]